jgi:hypothetical protein
MWNTYSFLSNIDNALIIDLRDKESANRGLAEEQLATCLFISCLVTDEHLDRFTFNLCPVLDLLSVDLQHELWVLVKGMT